MIYKNEKQMNMIKLRKFRTEFGIRWLHMKNEVFLSKRRVSSNHSVHKMKSIIALRTNNWGTTKEEVEWNVL